MIEVQDVYFSYPQQQRPLLAAFSACFAAAEIVGLSGPNGCGKTTLSKLLSGLLRPQQGRVLIDGEDIADWSLYQVGRRLGYVWQNPNRQLFASSVAEEVGFGLQQRGYTQREIAECSERWLDFFHLSHKKNALPLRLSLGEKQRLALAAVLALDPPYLLLDEPTAGLDRRCRRELGELLQRLAYEQGRGIIVISHEEEFVAKYCGREVALCSS